MLVGQRLVVVDVDPHIARARVGLGARRVVRAEAAAVGAPAAARRWRQEGGALATARNRYEGTASDAVPRVGLYHITNAGLSDATTVVAHDSASTSITPPADSRLASKKALVDRSSITINVRREGIRAGGWWQP